MTIERHHPNADQCPATSPGPAHAIVAFPEVIEAVSDTPLLLGPALGVEGSSGPQIIGIDGCAVDPCDVTALPGVRVGGVDGGGFVLRRALDHQLVFVPDADYTGLTSFEYTILDNGGETATILAIVNVLPKAQASQGLSFVDGTQWASVHEGVDAAIVGALLSSDEGAGTRAVFQVFEKDSDIPSRRFAVIGGTLKVTAPLDHSEDGVIHLRITASDGTGRDIAGAFEIGVRSRPLSRRVTSANEALVQTSGLGRRSLRMATTAGARVRRTDSETGALDTIDGRDS